MTMQVKTETGRIKDVGILEVTPENFICPSNERNMYHCRIEIKKTFNNICIFRSVEINPQRKRKARNAKNK